MNPSTSQSHTPIPVQEDSLSLLPVSKVLSLDSTMAVPVVRFPIIRLVRFIGVVVTAFVLTWAVHYRGGMALISENKDLIFNVIFLIFVLCSDLYALITGKM
ncbi:putative transmembrane ascorbate ferrireductase 2 [Vitis vinifera]|uniref:Putative transmembrane ascorbate ferrireductase 2 n=1 Tax=Vitis vinifera TaxID=29760 RepID=A0A438EB26_VITVI|nr:putative transmembrane ascorbate ferrireductase 2 [Vitis vinifera]